MLFICAQIKADVIKATVAKPGSKLRLVARAGVGVDNVDLAAATAAGVMVSGQLLAIMSC